jgi:hypothetical protein
MKLTQIIASATVAAVLGTAGYAVAGATSTPAATPTPTAAAAAAAPGSTSPAVNVQPRVRRRIVAGALKVAAQTIGITRKALVQELRGGKTIAAVATEHSVQPQAVIDAITHAATTRIEAAQAAGKITAKRAAKLEARLPALVPTFVNTWHLRMKTS